MTYSSPILLVYKSGGEYTRAHVEWLSKQLHKQPFVLTDKPEGPRDIPMLHNLPGWWSKLEMFRPNFILGDFLYMDLDTVPLREIERFCAYPKTVVLRDFYKPQRIGSGFMKIMHRDKVGIWDSFMKDKARAIQQMHGDQDFLMPFLEKHMRWQELCPGRVVSYKVENLGDAVPPSDIICFHGQPRPWDVSHPWIPKL